MLHGGVSTLLGGAMAQDIKLRLAGIAFILGGAVLGWFFALGPLREAQAGVAEISYSTKIFILVPFCLVFGLAFLLFGERFQYRNADHKNFTLAGSVAFIIAAALAAGGWWWFEQQFTALGYV
jgi:hypothetical protein